MGGEADVRAGPWAEPDPKGGKGAPKAALRRPGSDAGDSCLRGAPGSGSREQALRKQQLLATCPPSSSRVRNLVLDLHHLPRSRPSLLDSTLLYRKPRAPLALPPRFQRSPSRPGRAPATMPRTHLRRRRRARWGLARPAPGGPRAAASGGDCGRKRGAGRPERSAASSSVPWSAGSGTRPEAHTPKRGEDTRTPFPSPSFLHAGLGVGGIWKWWSGPWIGRRRVDPEPRISRIPFETGICTCCLVRREAATLSELQLLGAIHIDTNISKTVTNTASLSLSLTVTTPQPYDTESLLLKLSFPRVVTPKPIILEHPHTVSQR